MNARLRSTDLVLVAVAGVRARRLRAAFSALGIAIGVAAIVGVLGVAQSSQSALLARIDRLGTNLLTVENGRDIAGTEGTLPPTAPAMISVVPGVQAVAPTAELPGALARSPLVPSYLSSATTLRAVTPALLGTLRASMLEGRFLDAATGRYPVVVLGAGAAASLGVSSLDTPQRIWDGRGWLVVAGIMQPVDLAPEVDRSVLVGMDYARTALGFDGNPTRIYVRADPKAVASISVLLARTANPESPDQAQVQRPSDALTARLDVLASTTSLVVGLGAVALVIGGVGVANVMVIAVVERRSEIGLRRALGATRTFIALQFLAESLLLALLGDIGGVAIGVAVTAGSSLLEGWQAAVPVPAAWAGLGAALAIGGVAGLYPAVRAARLAPADALRAT